MKRISIVSFVLLFACLPLFSEDLNSSTLSLSIDASSSPRYEIGLSSSPVSDISSVVSPKSNLTLIGKDDGGGKIEASDSAHIYWKIVSTYAVNVLLAKPEPLRFSSATGENTEIPLTIIIGDNQNQPEYDHEFNRNGTILETEILSTKPSETLSVGNSVSVRASASININDLGKYSSSNYTSSLNIIVEVES